MSGHDYGTIEPRDIEVAVAAALDAGINFFDVADVYGFGAAEELLGRALGPRRNDAVIATKFGLRWDADGRVRRDSRPATVREALDDSLRRLGVDAIALYQLHWPDGTTPLDDVVAVIEEGQKAGKVRHFGVCNCSDGQLRETQWRGQLASVQVAHNLLCRSAEDQVLPWCEANGIAVLAHSGLARGFLSGKYEVGAAFPGSDTRSRSHYFEAEGRDLKERLLDGLRDIGARLDRPVASVALRWLLDDPRVTSVLTGVKHRRQLDDLVAALGWSLSVEDRDRLTSLSSACPGSLSGELAR